MLMIVLHSTLRLLPRRGGRVDRTRRTVRARLRMLCLVVAIAGATTENGRPAELQVWTQGEQATFVLPSLSGVPVSLDSQHGSLVLVHFFATWCEPCREELPALRRLVARSAGVGLTVLALSVAEPEERVRRFMEAFAVNFPVLLDGDRAVARSWQVHTLPTTFILDATLQPRLVVEGDFAWDSVAPEDLIGMFAPPQSKPAADNRRSGPNR